MKILLIISCFLVSIFLVPSVIFAQDSDKLNDLTKQIETYSKQIQNLQSQADTLSNQIAQFDAQILLTQAKIDQTQEQIKLLGGRIDQLEGSLSNLEKAYSNRVTETYKIVRVNDPIYHFLMSADLRDLVNRFNYLIKLQLADQSLLVRLQAAQNTYKDNKTEFEVLSKKLEEQRATIDGQKKAKTQLLAVTRNDEKKYQQLLASTRAELEAIQAIIAGRGKESKVGHVNESNKIASIIDGPSCNSGGRHLHFIVSENGVTKSPFSYLKSVDFENCSGSSCGSGDGDLFNPTGSWNWPILPKIKFTQGYGSTWATRNSWVSRIYNFHNGIDIDSYGSTEVKAVAAGDLFRGSYSGVNGCLLRYVRVDHDNSNLDTFYLHINY